MWGRGRGCRLAEGWERAADSLPLQAAFLTSLAQVAVPTARPTAKQLALGLYRSQRGNLGMHSHSALGLVGIGLLRP